MPDPAYDDSDLDLPLESDMDDEAGEPAADMYCPSCGAAVIPDTSKCPNCGDWMTPVFRRPGGIAWRRWLFVFAVLLMLLMLLAMLRFTF